MGDNPYREFVFDGGIDNINPAKTLRYNQLTQGHNIDIDNIGNIDFRDGQTESSSTATHSLWSNKAKDISLFVQAGYLKSNITTPVTLMYVGNTPMSYAEMNGLIYFSNNVIIGYTDGTTASLFSAPTEPYKKTMKPGNIVEFHNDRLFVIRGGIITWSDSLAFHRYDDRFYRLPISGYITLFKSVNDGIWSSWGGKSYFISGYQPQDFAIIEKADYGAIGQGEEATRELVGSMGQYGFEQFSEAKTVMWMSEKGECAGASEGKFRNVSIKHYKLPSNVKYAKSFFRVRNNSIGHFISSITN